MTNKNNNYNKLRKFTKKILAQKIEPDPNEQFFEYDPRALEELEYGKVRKSHTHLETKSVLDEF